MIHLSSERQGEFGNVGNLMSENLASGEYVTELTNDSQEVTNL